ncbi:MAG: hypothetical protein HDT47_10685, partial [Ruminococcaceae bacterium]|nr:hypothetical protein [Oscillospiraceae bacterium]
MKKLKVLFIAFSVTALTACSAIIPSSELTYIKPEKEPYIKSDTIKPEENYTMHDFIMSDGKIIATDSKNNCLIIIDPESGETKTQGQTGDGNDDYLHPRGIWLKDDTIYVMDSGNSRIKILDRDLSCKDSIDISVIELWGQEVMSYFNDISVDDNGNIFFTIDTSRKGEARLYCIESGSDKPKALIKGCSGVVASYGDKTYFANTWEHREDYAKQTGNSYIYEIEECKYIVSYSLPYTYASTGIYVGDDGMYCSSYSGQEVTKVDLDSLTAACMFSEPVVKNAEYNEREHYGAVYFENDTLWLLETNSNEIYKLE